MSTNTPRELSLQSVRFKRSANSPFESGILVNEGQLIIDMLGKKVPEGIWWFQADGDLVVHYRPEQPLEKGVKRK